LRTELRETELEIVIASFEIKYQQNIGHEDGDKRSERGAGNAEPGPGSNTKDQQRCQDHIQDDTENLEADSRLDNARRAQSRS